MFANHSKQLSELEKLPAINSAVTHHIPGLEASIASY